MNYPKIQTRVAGTARVQPDPVRNHMWFESRHVPAGSVGVLATSMNGKSYFPSDSEVLVHIGKFGSGIVTHFKYGDLELITDEEYEAGLVLQS